MRWRRSSCSSRSIALRLSLSAIPTIANRIAPMAGPVERGIYLASRSPRRRELLSQIGVRFHLLLFRARPGEGPDVDEISMPGEKPDVYVERMARAKPEAGWRRRQQRNLPLAPALPAAPTVSLAGQLFCKPPHPRH